MSYHGDPGLPAGYDQDAMDRAINGDPERGDCGPDWICPHCQWVNYAIRDICRNCGFDSGQVSEGAYFGPKPRGPAVSPPKPLDFLDMIAEARRSLDQAEHAMHEDRYAPSAVATAWARRARDYASERWGAGQIDDTPDDERNDPMDEPVDRFEDDPGDAGDYVEMDEEEECQL